MRHGPAAALVSVVLLLAACSQEVRGVASPASSAAAPPSSTAPAPSPAPDPAPQEPAAGTEDRSGPAQPGSAGDDTAHVTGLNSQSDASSVRLVVNLSGSGVPEWSVAYSDATGPDGRPVDIAGDAFLRVRVKSGGVGGNQGSSSFSISPGPVAEARTLGSADGYDEVLIGVRGGEQPFTVEALTDPGRLVVDIRTAG
jgi:hypothetical protein